MAKTTGNASQQEKYNAEIPRSEKSGTNGKSQPENRLLSGKADFIYTVFVRDGVTFKKLCAGACERVTGYTQDEIENDKDLWLHVVPDEDRGFVSLRNERLFAGDNPGAIEYKIVRKDGAIRWVLNSTVPVSDEVGRRLLYDFIFRDITDEKLIEESRLWKDRFFSLFEAMTEGAFLVSREGIITHVNSASTRILNLSSEEIIGKSFFLPWNGTESPNEGSQAQDGSAIRSAINRQEELDNYMYEMTVPGMPANWIRVEVKQIRPNENSLTSSIVTFTDVTWMVERDREDRRLRMELEAIKKKVPVGYITTCSSCKKVRDKNGEWVALESFITTQTGADFSHGICPVCGVKLYGDLYTEIAKNMDSSSGFTTPTI